MHRVYAIRNTVTGARVCERSTKKACIEMLDMYVTDPETNKHWGTGPYAVFRIETTLVYRHRPRRVTPRALRTGKGAKEKPSP